MGHKEKVVGKVQASEHLLEGTLNAHPLLKGQGYQDVSRSRLYVGECVEEWTLFYERWFVTKHAKRVKEIRGRVQYVASLVVDVEQTRF